MSNEQKEAEQQEEPEWKTKGWAFDPGGKRIVDTPCRAKAPGQMESACEGRTAMVSGKRQGGTGLHIAQFRCLICGKGWTFGY